MATTEPPPLRSLLHQVRAMVCESLKTVLDASLPSRMVHTLELRPSSVYRKLGAGRPPALHGNHADHLLPKLGGRFFIGEHLAQDRRVDGAELVISKYRKTPWTSTQRRNRILILVTATISPRPALLQDTALKDAG